MAQIDASIPLQARGPQIRDPLEVYGNALNVQGMQQRNALAQRAMQQEDAARAQAMADQEVLRAYFQAGPGADNLNALRSRPHLFTAEQKRLMDMDKEAAEIGGKKATTEKTQNEVRANQFMQIAHTMRGVKDQASYAGAMELVASLFGPDMVGKLPPQYDPATVQKMLDGALTQAQAVQNQTATRGQDMTDARTRSEGAANRAVTMRGQTLTDARAREEGAANRAASAAKTTPADKRVTQAKNALEVLNEADKLIDQSTGSYIGAGVDMGMRAIGQSTPGAEASARLKVLQAALMLNMPRMEGPQSDRDVQLYREAAGQIGDPTIPAPIKKAASATIRTLNEQYAGVAPSAPANLAGGGGAGWGIRRID